MKKNYYLKFYILLTVFFMFATLFSMIKPEFPGYVSGISILLFLASIFLLVGAAEKVLTRFLEEKELPPLDLPDDTTTSEEEIHSKIAKANYVIQKRILALLEERLSSEKEPLQSESSEEELIKVIKASIKYDRANTNQIVESLEDTSKKTLEEILPFLQKISKEVQMESKALQELDKKFENFMNQAPVNPMPAPSVVTENEPVVIEEVMAEPTASEPSDPNKMMSPDDIAALIAATNAQEEIAEAVPETKPETATAPVAPESSDPNKMMSPDDIAALIAATNAQGEIAEAVPETKPEIATAPVAPEPSDPNKMMSPDDIAALIASLGE